MDGGLHHAARHHAAATAWRGVGIGAWLSQVLVAGS